MSKSRIASVDFLRGMAAVFVVIFHVSQVAMSAYGLHSGDFGLVGSIFFPFDFGAYGVQVFFVISGYVILMTLSKIKSLSDFAWSRFIRLYPFFWVAVIFTTLWRIFFGGDRVGAGQFFANLTMVPDLWGSDFVDGVYWTLLVELQFYIFLALVWKFRLIDALPKICIIWLSLSVLGKIVGLNHYGWGDFLWHSLLLPYSPYFTLGMMAFQMRQLKGLNTLVMIFAMVVVFLTSTLARSLLIVCTICCVIPFSPFRWINENIPRPFIFLGEASYSIYLFHQAFSAHLILALRPYFSGPLMAFIIVFSAALGLGMLMHLYVERNVISVARTAVSRIRVSQQAGN
jgi:peptidoglycan/LPS O-acetylase OafA/YrhL